MHWTNWRYKRIITGFAGVKPRFEKGEITPGKKGKMAGKSHGWAYNGYKWNVREEQEVIGAGNAKEAHPGEQPVHPGE